MYDVVSEAFEVDAEHKPTGFLGTVNRGALGEFRNLFLVDAINRVTRKDYLISFDQLVNFKMNKSSLDTLLTELFITRPCLNTLP